MKTNGRGGRETVYFSARSAVYFVCRAEQKKCALERDQKCERIG